MLQEKGKGPSVELSRITKLRGADRFSLYEAGLVNRQGLWEGPSWKMVSHKAPGTDNMTDDLIHGEDKEYWREEIALWVMSILNDGRSLDAKDKEIKVMLQSKVGKEVVPNLSDIRIIGIPQLRVKVLEATIRHITQDVMMDFQQNQQVAFKNGVGDTELQILKALQLCRKYRYVIKCDMSSAFDSVRKDTFI